MNGTAHGDPGVRERLVAAAVELLAEQGPGALQARRLAREVDTSTMAVYHYFGGMPQLLAAVIEDGFRRLDAQLAAVPATADPVADIARLALAYRIAARGNPHLYDLMFGLSAPGGHHPQEHNTATVHEHNASRRAYSRLTEAADRAIHAGRLHQQDPASVAAQLWSLLHGYVTLELAGHFDELDGLTQVLTPMGINLFVGLGDTPEHATRSAALVDNAATSS